MDFGAVIGDLSSFLEERGHRWAVIGGVALVTLPGVDRLEIRRYFERHGLVERFDELEKTL